MIIINNKQIKCSIKVNLWLLIKLSKLLNKLLFSIDYKLMIIN